MLFWTSSLIIISGAACSILADIKKSMSSTTSLSFPSMVFNISKFIIYLSNVLSTEICRIIETLESSLIHNFFHYKRVFRSTVIFFAFGQMSLGILQRRTQIYDANKIFVLGFSQSSTNGLNRSDKSLSSFEQN